MPKDTYRVGVIGCGRKGTQHARAWNLTPGAEVVAAAENDPENADLFRRRFGVPVYDDYREMLRNENIDIAAPILPVSANHEVVMGCAEHGVKGILCEKPITDSLAHADEMVATCRAKGIAFGCGDLDRNLPDYTRAKAIIDSGEIGEVVAIDLHGGSSTEWDIQGMSLTRLFAGDAEAAWVIGWVTGDPYSDHDQGQAGYIRFANGIEAFRHTNKNAKNGIEVLCTMGSFYTDFLYLKMWKLEDPDVKPGWSNGMVEIEGLFKEESQYAESGTHDEDGWRWAETRNLASVQVMIEAIENGVDPIGSGENSRKCLEIAIALRESHRRGRTPVRLPLEDRSTPNRPSHVALAQQEGDDVNRGLPHLNRQLEAGLASVRHSFLRRNDEIVYNDEITYVTASPQPSSMSCAA